MNMFKLSMNEPKVSFIAHVTRNHTKKGKNSNRDQGHFRTKLPRKQWHYTEQIDVHFTYHDNNSVWATILCSLAVTKDWYSYKRIRSPSHKWNYLFIVFWYTMAMIHNVQVPLTCRTHMLCGVLSTGCIIAHMLFQHAQTTQRKSPERSSRGDFGY